MDVTAFSNHLKSLSKPYILISNPESKAAFVVHAQHWQKSPVGFTYVPEGKRTYMYVYMQHIHT